ncbi:MAG: hypothetical protein HY898_09145 [Deltaproteobacteria bacterium]|nr:hypothetical protein [Deltaproteobacteria bacterium]
MRPSRPPCCPLLALAGCALVASACGSASDPATDVSTDASTDASSSDAPALDAVAPVSPNALVLQFKGMINTVEEVSDVSHTTFALSKVIAYLGTEVLSLDEDPYAFAYRYPDNYPVPEYRGREVLVIDALRKQDGSMADYRADMAQVIVPLETLRSKPRTFEVRLGPGDGVTVSIRKLTGFYRADKVTLAKDCYRAVTDPGTAASAIVIDATGNQEFTPGESLFAQGNLALLADPDGLAKALSGKLEEHDGLWCSCRLNDNAISCAQWEEEVAKDVSSLSCGLPDGYKTPISDSHAIFTFKGVINDLAAAPQYGSGVFDVKVEGQPCGLEYSSYAARATVESGPWAGKPYLAITSLGGVETIAKGRYRFKYASTSVLEDTLAALKNGQKHQGFFDAQHPFYFALYDAWQADIGADQLIKLCPQAVGDLSVTTSSIYVCHENNESFAVGENLELAGNIELTADPTQTGASGPDGGCACYKNNAALDCALFPEM